MCGRVMNSWWMGSLAVNIAGAYERVGIWTKGRSAVESENETGTALGKSDEEVEAMEEGRDLEDVVDEKVLEMEKRWVEACGLRIGVDLVGMGLFGWALFRKVA